MVVMLWLRHVVHGVVQISHKTEHQAFVGGMYLKAIVTLFVGDGAYIGDFPIDVDTGKWLQFSVNLFVNGSFDNVLSKSRGHQS